VSAIVICSGKGSPGATFVAVNLATALARAHDETILLDLDPAGGDVCGYLGLDPRRGLYPLLRMEGAVTTSERLLAEAEERSGVTVLGGFPDASDIATPDVCRSALAAADGRGRMVVADIGRVSTTNAPVAAEAALVLLVVRADLVSVLGAERALRHLGATSASQERIRIVVSAHDRRRPADLAEVGEALGLPVLGAVPHDRRGARKALITQCPATTPRLVRAFEALAKATRRAVNGRIAEERPAAERELMEAGA
jgi:MinD-like ATPase involved in chromosome partitioning or flagellar assembly